MRSSDLLWHRVINPKGEISQSPWRHGTYRQRSRSLNKKEENLVRTEKLTYVSICSNLYHVFCYALRITLV
jgi:alkylated DNA nucleotide flippase Atl1